jgi:hypothetical protein
MLRSDVLVPACAVLRSPELVLTRLARRNRALCNSRRSVLLARVQLAESVEMEAGTVVLKAVLHIYNDSIAPVSSKGWSWVNAIDQHHRTVPAASIRVRHRSVGNFQVVLQEG